MLFKLFISGKVENKGAFIAITVAAVIMGIVNLIYEPSFADILKGWGQ